MKSVWIPEAPDHSGLYANEQDPNPGKIKTGKAVSTYSVYSARQFATREECQAWCDANPSPRFVPVEHGFYERGGREDVMSYGLVVCSECKRELEQRGGKWFHVEALIDGRVMPICAGATAIYPELDENQRGGREEGK